MSLFSGTPWAFPLCEPLRGEIPLQMKMNWIAERFLWKRLHLLWRHLLQPLRRPPCVPAWSIPLRMRMKRKALSHLLPRQPHRQPHRQLPLLPSWIRKRVIKSRSPLRTGSLRNSKRWIPPCSLLKQVTQKRTAIVGNVQVMMIVSPLCCPRTNMNECERSMRMIPFSGWCIL